jgi:hypothetical protein
MFYNQEKAAPLKSTRVLVIEANLARSNRLERDLKSLGASVLIASSVALARPKLTETDVVLMAQETVPTMVCDQPKVVVAETDRKGLDSLMAGQSDWYVTPLFSPLELGRAILHAREKTSTPAEINAKASSMLTRACAL